jgi:hypothetical protein
MSVLVTELEFELPKGYVDAEGNLHRAGVMRLATAADEIYPLKDPRVRNWPAYLIIILLSRVVIRLGTLADINPGVIEGLFSEDLAYLQDMYNQVNGLTPRTVTVECPRCGHRHEAEVPLLGGLPATPWTGSARRQPSSDDTCTGP